MHVLSLTKDRFKEQTSSKMFWVKLQLLFDSVLHQQTDVGVRHWKAVTHIHLPFGLLCCNRNRTCFTFSSDKMKTAKKEKILVLCTILL